MGGIFLVLFAIACVCLLGNAGLIILRKHDCIRYDLYHSKLGVFATGKLIQRALDTVTATSLMASIQAGSTGNLLTDGVLRNGYLNGSGFSTANDGGFVYGSDCQRLDGRTRQLPPLAKDEYKDKMKVAFDGDRNKPLPEIQT